MSKEKSRKFERIGVLSMNEKTIGALSKFTGISAHTIKYYEKIGMVSAQRQASSNYRSYNVRVCTDLYECIKYRNMGFSLKQTKELLKEADDERLLALLKERNIQLEEEIEQLLQMQQRVTYYEKEIENFDQKIGKWYIEESPAFYFRVQTKGLAYEEQVLQDMNINFIDYSPLCKTVVCLKKEYFEGDFNEFAWGLGVMEDAIPQKDVLETERDLLYVQSKRSFVTYLRMTGKYVSDGSIAQAIREQYRKYSIDKLKTDVFGIRVKITHDEKGNDWNYLKIIVPIIE